MGTDIAEKPVHTFPFRICVFTVRYSQLPPSPENIVFDVGYSICPLFVFFLLYYFSCDANLSILRGIHFFEASPKS